MTSTRIATLSAIMTDAWRLFKNKVVSNFSSALRLAWSNARYAAKQAVVSSVSELARMFAKLDGGPVQKGDFRHDALIAAAAIRDAGLGFASTVATSVCQYRKCSEKQAWVLASAAKMTF